jgi:LCP family protein required for cell wall assembly
MSQYPDDWFREQPGSRKPASTSAPRSSSAGPRTRILPPQSELLARAPQRQRRGGSGRKILRALLVLLLVLAIAALAMVVYIQLNLRRVEVLTEYEGRPAATPGTDWLIVGSDSRAGSELEGEVGGERADTIMLLHTGDSGVTLVSIPRDSYVGIPAYGDQGASQNKINAAYAFGGADLLARTVEVNTGIRLDHYVEIGFGGFTGIVDALGGVQLCVEEPLVDEVSGADFPEPGCYRADGFQSLAFVRARKTDPRGDLGRVERQQQFLSAVFAETLSPGTLLNPFQTWRVVNAGLDALVVDPGFGVWDGLQLFRALRQLSDPETVKTTVPISDPDFRPGGGVGSTVRWDDEKAERLFSALRADQPVPVALPTARRVTAGEVRQLAW